MKNNTRLIILLFAIFIGFIVTKRQEQQERLIVNDKIELIKPVKIFEEIIVYSPDIGNPPEPILKLKPRKLPDSITTKTKTLYINPNRVPQTKVWNLKIAGGETIQNLTEHLFTDHQVPKELVQGWTLQQLRRLHAYRHNGYSLKNLYEYIEN